MNTRNVKQLKVLIFTLIAIVTLGIGYAGITAINLVINGDATASVNDQNFKVKFLSEENVTPTITGEGNTVSVKDDTTAEFSVSTLTGLGDSEVATFRVKNESKGIGADISLNVTSSNSEYFKVTEYVQDTQLQAGDETTVTVTVEMIKTPIENEVSTSITAKLIANAIEDETATGSSPATKVAGEPESFSTDSWATIKAAVHNGNTSAYKIGDTKTITINGTDYTVRIANKTTSANCSSETYSETACGFVVEFVDIIAKMKMKNINSNVGGYPATLVFDYLNNTLLGQLPSDLRSVIEPTRVISGYGCISGWDKSNETCSNPDNSANNFITIDNLYLLSGVEVFGSDPYDTAANTTTQLEYYQNTSNSRIKQYDNSNSWWWLRNAPIFASDTFRCFNHDGTLHYANASYFEGISPAFRIA